MKPMAINPQAQTAPVSPTMSSLGKKSTFSHFMREAEDVINAKDEFKAILRSANFENPFDRQQAIRHARNMINDEVTELFSNDSTMAIRSQIAMMEQFDRDLLMYEEEMRTSGTIIKQRVALFTESADSFLLAFSKAQHQARLGLQTTKDISETEKLFSVLDIPRFEEFGTNSYGVKISLQMVKLAWGLCLRTINEWDNVITIDAMPGTGKTTFDFALITTMIDVYKNFFGIEVKFDINENVFVDEEREYCMSKIKNAPKFSMFMFIEAGNQFNAKGTWNDDQQDLVNMVERIRFHGLTLPLEWNTIEGLDKTVRDRRSTLAISIEKRSKAIVRGFNRNPGKRGLTINPRTKDNIALMAEQASTILEIDPLTVLEVPYFTLPVEWKKRLDDRKEEGSKRLGSKRRVLLYYSEFMAQLQPNAIRITSDELRKFAVTNHQALSMTKLAQMIAEGIGLGKTKKLFHNTDMADVNVGFIELDDVMRSYIAHVKAEVEGYKQYQRERPKEGGTQYSDKEVV